MKEKFTRKSRPSLLVLDTRRRIASLCMSATGSSQLEIRQKRTRRKKVLYLKKSEDPI